MKKLLIVAHYAILPGEGRDPRLVFIYDFLKKKGIDVSLITCDFNHNDKEKRDINVYIEKNLNYKIMFLHGYKYKRNLSIVRFLSQKKVANELADWLENNGDQFDIFYCPIPTAELANVVEDYCEKNNKKTIIDVRDLWPDAMKIFIKNEVICKVLFEKYSESISKAYSRADAVVGVSKQYVDVALKVNEQCKLSAIVYQGVNIRMFDSGVDEFAESIIKPFNEFWVIYTGKLGNSYDVETVIEGINDLQDQGYKSIKFLILGKGPTENKLKKLVSRLHASEYVRFLGYKSYKEMAAYLNKSDVAVNALVKNAPQTIVNKLGDYFASGTTVLSSSQCVEVKNMIDDYNLGYNYIPEDKNDFAQKLKLVFDSPKDRERFGVNARELAKGKFDREVIYSRIYSIVEQLY